MMRKAFFFVTVLVSLAGARLAVAQETPPPAEETALAPQPHIAYLDKSRTIYIADFESSSETAPTVQVKDGPIDNGSMGSPRLHGTDPEPAGDSRRVTKLLADSLLREIKKAGYKPKLLGSGDRPPDEGLLISGVFAQMGKDGQLRRVVMGYGQPAGDIQLYVTTSNLLRLAKPLYEIVKQGADGRVAAVPIKLNPDVATLKFCLAGNPSDKAVKKTAEQIVAELQRLTLQAESEGLAGSDDPLNKYSKP
jgi:Domain of unknown function (DUF4410)